MGIHGLSKVIGDNAPRAVKESDIKAYEGGKYNIYSLLRVSGRRVAVDASMSIYQFLIAVRSNGDNLTNQDGETTR